MKTNISILLVSSLLISGCSFTPALQIKTPELPTNMHDSNTTVHAITTEWWKQFEDPALDTLIDEALRNSDDLHLAVSHVNYAKALLGVTTSERYPNINANSSGNRQKTSEESLSPFGGQVYNTYNLSASVGYEIDFWGKLKNRESAAFSELLSTQADQDTVRITLISDVAQTYFNLVALKKQIEITTRNIDSFQEEYEYRQHQYRSGAIDALTVEQSHTLYANAKFSLESLKESKTLTENALAILVGRNPKELIQQNLVTSTDLPKPLVIPYVIPSDVLQRRPDIYASEERLRATNANIGVAKAAYFPSISLTGSVGLESSDLNRLMQNSATVWGIGPSLNIPIFDFGRIKNQVNAAEASKETASIEYAKTVKNAFRDVYDSLKKIEYSQTKISTQTESLNAYTKSLYLSKVRYDAGYIDYLHVLEARRGELNANLNLTTLQAEMLMNQITLYKALGGGWKVK